MHDATRLSGWVGSCGLRWVLLPAVARGTHLPSAPSGPASAANGDGVSGVDISDILSYIRNMMDDETPKHRSSKNTRRWCKGKKGLVHVTDVFEKTMELGPNYKFRWQVLYCKACGKELETFAFGGGANRKVPGWVKT